ncbi:unnamed protein product [Wuchereria bancrofti]|uniref:tRNA-guanine(15) transglycosylase-like domain-containing protein n=1 Tax=Wuchereria bancrofti TaxID=6293 RepID=A0A3P7DVI4_WUCBA|nr:unnamed protein product [Wuchereria bancrofti]
MVKFVVQRSTVNGRIGKIFCWGNVNIEHETPSCMMYTRAGHIPHLTWDVAAAHLRHRQSPIYQLTLPSLFEALPVIEKSGGGIARFASMPEGAPTHLTLTDPLMERNMKFNNENLVSIETIKKLLRFSHVSSYETMFDYGTPEGCSNKRLEKALERTVKFSRELLRSDSFEGSVALIALCGGHSPSHHERCASAIGSLPKGCGFVLDLMQFAKRLRVLPKKTKVRKISEMDATDTTVQLKSSNCEALENISSLDVVITESEFDKDVIKDLLAGVWPHISPSHLRLVNGAFSPTEVVALAHLGIDLFDSSYAIFLAEQGKAFVCSENFPEEATFSVFDFTDTLYSEDFRPVCKSCRCYTCRHYTRSYLRHLTNTVELLGPVLLVIHNIQEYERMFALLRENLSRSSNAKISSAFMCQKRQTGKNSWRKEAIRDLRLDKRFDWVGPPDDISKIRPVRLRRLSNETEQERKYREAREALIQWSSQFWTHHNILFEKKKAEFVEQRKKNLGRLEHSNALDMSEFYKEFLDQQYNNLTNYNREWYYRNVKLFWPAFKVQLIRFRRTLHKFLRK